MVQILMKDLKECLTVTALTTATVWQRGVACCVLLWQVMFRRGDWGQGRGKNEGEKPITILRGSIFSILFDLCGEASVPRRPQVLQHFSVKFLLFLQPFCSLGYIPSCLFPSVHAQAELDI